MLTRGPAHVRRIASIYALAELSPAVRVDHLRAALAFWEYSLASARFIFGDEVDQDAVKVLDALRAAEPIGLRRTEISKLFSGHRSKAKLDKLISAGRNNVGPLFIQTLNTYPYEPTRDFYQHTLGMKMRMEVKTRRDDGARMSAVRATEYCSIQIDEFAASTPQRPASPGCFSAGVNMCTFTTRALDPVKDALTKANVKFTQVTSNACPRSTSRGFSVASRPVNAAASARTPSSVTPGRSRPNAT